MKRVAVIARRVGTAVIVTGAVLVFGALLALVQQAPAGAAPPHAFTLAFDDLAPGSPETRSDSFQLERNAALTSFAWLARVGVMTDATLTVTVCDTAGTCIDPAALTDPVSLSAGDIEVTMTTELADTVPSGGSGSVTGQLTFVADDDLTSAGGVGGAGGLASTGVAPMLWLAAGAVAVAAGVGVVAASSRRSPRNRET